MINFELFNEKSKILINDSQNKALEKNHQQVTPEHLVFMVLQNNDDYLKDILEDCKANLAKIRISLESEIKKFPSILGNNLNIYFSSDLVKIFLKSKSLINEFNDSFISPEILIYSILNCDNLVIYDLLVKNGLNKESF